MVWEDFSSSGFGDIVRCENPIKSKEYINIFQKGHLSTIDKFSLWHIVQISISTLNTPPHTAKFTKECISENLYKGWSCRDKE